MTIRIEQICNGCGRKRELEAFGITGPREIRSVANEGGWKEVAENVHLCRTCIRAALKGKVSNG